MINKIGLCFAALFAICASHGYDIDDHIKFLKQGFETTLDNRAGTLKMYINENAQKIDHYDLEFDILGYGRGYIVEEQQGKYMYSYLEQISRWVDNFCTQKSYKDSLNNLLQKVDNINALNVDQLSHLFMQIGINTHFSRLKNINTSELDSKEIYLNNYDDYLKQIQKTKEKLSSSFYDSMMLTLESLYDKLDTNSDTYKQALEDSKRYWNLFGVRYFCEFTFADKMRFSRDPLVSATCDAIIELYKISNIIYRSVLFTGWRNKCLEHIAFLKAKHQTVLNVNDRVFLEQISEWVIYACQERPRGKYSHYIKYEEEAELREPSHFAEYKSEAIRLYAPILEEINMGETSAKELLVPFMKICIREYYNRLENINGHTFIGGLYPLFKNAKKILKKTPIKSVPSDVMKFFKCKIYEVSNGMREYHTQKYKDLKKELKYYWNYFDMEYFCKHTFANKMESSDNEMWRITAAAIIEIEAPKGYERPKKYQRPPERTYTLAKDCVNGFWITYRRYKK